jgi:coenzyme Q-binding protein COQ10
MTQHKTSRTVRVSRSLLFDIVADVERYPEFLPMWKNVQVTERQGSVYKTVQLVGFGPIRETFATQTVLVPPERIEVTSDDPLFKTFLIRWTFGDLGDACRVDIELDWRTRRRLLQRAIDILLPETARSMIRAFENRAIAMALSQPSDDW